MANTLKLKRSAVPGRVPQTSDLQLGELALNTNDGKLYTKKSVGGVDTIVDLSAGTAGGASVTVSTTPPSSPNDGDLWWDSTNGVLKVFYNDGTSTQWVDANTGAIGPQGVPGAGVISGGTTGQVLAKVSGTDYDTQWANPSQPFPTGGVSGDILLKSSSTNYDTSWTNLDAKARTAVGSINGQITGFVDRTSSTITFNESTRVLSIAPTGASFDVYYRGEKHTYSSALTFTVPDTSQGKYYSINPTTWALYDAGTFGDIKNSINAAYVMWDATNSKALIIGDERHSVTGDPEWHYVHHRNVGTIWRSGGSLTYTLNNASAVSVAVAAPLVIADEDLEHTITHAASPTNPFEQILTGAASLPVMYLNGTTYVMTTASTTPWVAGTTTARYNPISGGSGSLADAGEGKYISYWLVATNSQVNPVRLVMGRLAHDTVDAAYQENFEGYGVSVAEIVAMYQIVLQTSTAYTANTPHVVIAAVRTIQDRVAASSSTFSATSHDSLTDRQDPDQHTIGAITGLQTALDAKQDDLVSGTSIKTVKSTSLLGSGDIPINEPPSGGTTGQVLTKDTNTDHDYSWQTPSSGATLTHAEASLSADVQMPSSNTWYNGPSVSLDAGTWLVTAHLTQVRAATTAETIYGRISDGTNHYASQQGYHASVSGTGVPMTMTAVITLGSTTTIRAQMATSAGNANSLIKAAMTANSAGNNASQITAIRVA
jgi:hypothetical protein